MPRPRHRAEDRCERCCRALYDTETRLCSPCDDEETTARQIAAEDREDRRAHG
jgi:ribosomal protein L37E